MGNTWEDMILWNFKDGFAEVIREGGQDQGLEWAREGAMKN